MNHDPPSIALLASDKHIIHSIVEHSKLSVATHIDALSVGTVDEIKEIIKHSGANVVVIAETEVSDALKHRVFAFKNANFPKPILVLLEEMDEQAAVSLIECGAENVLSTRPIDVARLDKEIARATARHRSSLARANARLSSHASDLKPQIIFETDLDFYITFLDKLSANPCCSSQWQIRPGYNFLDFLALEERKRVLRHVDRIFKGETLGVVEYVARNPSGATFPIFAELFPIYEQDVPGGIRFAILDISQKRQADAERKRVEEQLQRSEKLEAVGLMATGVAHDFNNVLGVICAIASSLADEKEEVTSIGTDLQGIVNACKRGGELANTLMRFARGTPDQRERVSVNNQVREIELLLSNLVDRKIRVSVDLETGPAFVNGNPSQLNHALLNICLNSAYAMDGYGEIRLTTRRVQVTPTYAPFETDLLPGAYVVIEVSDTGLGMGQDIVDRAFEPFFTTHPDDGGTGLGLAMVAKTVAEHNGEVTIQSRQGQGTRISIYLPAASMRTSMPTALSNGATSDNRKPDTAYGVVLSASKPPNTIPPPQA
ncbi:MAG: ATP-binding protein [Myxococcota bacterium]|nr:ATP-binding protein [Myxococcota bacterium]